MRTFTRRATATMAVAALMLTAMATLARSPVDRLDAATRTRGSDPEAGLATLEYVIIAAVVLGVVIAVLAVVTGALEGWAEQIPEP